MIRKILIPVIFFLCFENLHCAEIDDSIYRDLCSFLVSENKIEAKDTVGIEPSEFIRIYDILRGDKVNLNDKFGIFLFNRIGYDHLVYILIKKDYTYAVFRENDPILILKYLFLKIEECPQIVSPEDLNKFVKYLIKINDPGLLIGEIRGKLTFITP